MNQANPQGERSELLIEASNGLNIPTAAEKRMVPHGDSGKENKLLKSHSMSANDVDRAIDGEAT
jgi:hypothetical protein